MPTGHRSMGASILEIRALIREEHRRILGTAAFESERAFAIEEPPPKRSRRQERFSVASTDHLSDRSGIRNKAHANLSRHAVATRRRVTEAPADAPQRFIGTRLAGTILSGRRLRRVETRVGDFSRDAFGGVETRVGDLSRGIGSLCTRGTGRDHHQERPCAVTGGHSAFRLPRPCQPQALRTARRTATLPRHRCPDPGPAVESAQRGNAPLEPAALIAPPCRRAAPLKGTNDVRPR